MGLFIFTFYLKFSIILAEHLNYAIGEMSKGQVIVRRVWKFQVVKATYTFLSVCILVSGSNILLNLTTDFVVNKKVVRYFMQ